MTIIEEVDNNGNVLTGGLPSLTFSVGTTMTEVAPPFVVFERWEPGISTSSILILKSQGVHVRTSPPNENRVGWGNLVVVVAEGINIKDGPARPQG
jgi:hypothetical protein